MSIFDERRVNTHAKLAEFEAKLKEHLGSDLAKAVGDHTTVYVTGSGGRGEMSGASDLDLFLVRATGRPSGLDAALLQSAIIRATRDCGIERGRPRKVCSTVRRRLGIAVARCAGTRRPPRLVLGFVVEPPSFGTIGRCPVSEADPGRLITRG